MICLWHSYQMLKGAKIKNVRNGRCLKRVRSRCSSLQELRLKRHKNPSDCLDLGLVFAKWALLYLSPCLTSFLTIWIDIQEEKSTWIKTLSRFKLNTHNVVVIYYNTTTIHGALPLAIFNPYIVEQWVISYSTACVIALCNAAFCYLMPLHRQYCKKSLIAQQCKD